MRKVLLALLIAPAAASAQVPTLDPGSSGPPPPAPAPAAKPAAPPAPTVMVVGPDGKVSYGGPKQDDAASGYYYYGEPDSGQTEEDPYTLHTGPTPELHVVRRGDTLWGICGIYFNDPWQWPKVWSYNPQVTNPHWIYPGDLVRLLPKGMFSEQQTDTQPQTPVADGGAEQPKPDNLPAPAQKSSVALKRTAFVEKADLDKSITIDGSVDEKELLGLNDSVYLAYPSNNPPKVGQRYSIYRPDNSVKSGGKEVGSYVKIVGTVEVVSVKQDKRARGVIVEANQEIERGQKVGPLMKEFTNVNPTAPKVDAQGAIVAMLTKEHLIGQGEIVFVDLGKNSGVEVGNRMFVVRRGDALPGHSENTVGQDDRRFPARALGEIVIVEVGNNVSIGLVTLAVQEMGKGDIVMMQKQQ